MDTNQNSILIAGYFIGFYEMKYKIVKLMLDNKIKEEQQEE